MTKLEKRLVKLDVTNTELCKRTGLHKSQISRFVNGVQGPQGPTLMIAFRIAAALDCKIEDVFAAE